MKALRRKGNTSGGARSNVVVKNKESTSNVLLVNKLIDDV